MRLVFLFSGLLFFMACKKSTNNAGGSVKTVPAATLLDLSYGSDASQKLDIYLPANRSVDSTKVIFLVHGGAWSEGDKSDFNTYVSIIQANLPQYAVVNINYRLAENNQDLFPAQEDDVKAAASFVFNKKNTYLVSDKWAWLGASAGGHLALLQSYKYASPVIPQAVVSFFGPTDLIGLYNSNPLIAIALEHVTGTTPAIDSNLYKQWSPVDFVSAQSPPTLLLQGGADPLVPPAQATELLSILQDRGVPNQYVFYPNEGHGWTGANLADSFNKIFAFLRMHVK